MYKYTGKRFPHEEIVRRLDEFLQLGTAKDIDIGDLFDENNLDNIGMDNTELDAGPKLDAYFPNIIVDDTLIQFICMYLWNDVINCQCESKYLRAFKLNIKDFYKHTFNTDMSKYYIVLVFESTNG